MAIKTIILAPDPRLTTATRLIEDFDASVQEITQDLVDTLVAVDGAGLAAPQIGSDLSIVAIKIGTTATDDGREEVQIAVLFNPKIVTISDDVETEFEGCLSMPGLQLPIKRATEIEIDYQLIDGSAKTLNASGHLARVIQHEIDHLDGRLMSAHVSKLKLDMARKRAARLARSLR